MSGNRRRYEQPRGYRPQPSTVPRKRAADEQEDAWVAQEDKFVLRQAKKKAILRVRGGRAKPIDWLAVILHVIDKSDDFLDEDEEKGELDMIDPEGMMQGLDEDELAELERDIDTYLTREINQTNKEFWNTMKVICRDRLEKIQATSRAPRGVKSITADVDRMFSTKTPQELGTLEKQIRGKLNSDEDIDLDYWEHLLKTLLVWKAKAKLKGLSEQVINEKLQKLSNEQKDEAIRFRNGLQSSKLEYSGPSFDDASLDPEPSLKLGEEYKKHKSVQEREFLDSIAQERAKVMKLGFVPMREPDLASSKSAVVGGNEDSIATSDLYERERARGVNEDEEVFAGEETVVTTSTAQWSSKYRPRKPKYFNRVQMGYDWNKYNQTHYDHDNPPPKVVQGYKFNVFYPDLIDKTKAPTYKIEREGGRKRGQTLAPAGEEDTCLIRFMAGPPYEDIAFRIVDREWDFSSKRERGFRSSFENVGDTMVASKSADNDRVFFSSIFNSKRFSIENNHSTSTAYAESEIPSLLLKALRNPEEWWYQFFRSSGGWKHKSHG